MQFAVRDKARFPAGMLGNRTCVAAFALALLAACATSPPAEPFAGRLAAAQAAGSPYQVDAALTDLLADERLAPSERAEALYWRGSLRRLDGDNRRGAVADFEEMLALSPDHPMAEQARTELAQASADADALEAQLGRLLTLPEWFDVSWRLGERDTPVARYRSSGLSPTEDETRKLQEAGYVCGRDGKGGPVQGFGDLRSWLDGLTWCSPEAAS